MTDKEWKNRLYFGDNLDILRDHIADESVDLIYLDPPFNSNASYNVLFAEKNGTRSRAQITAFEDTWHWGYESEYAYQDVVTNGPQKLADLLQAMRSFLADNDMMAYLVMMAQRMVELHRVLKSTGSIYLHCDPTASHFLKLIMDAVFGLANFRNEIVWKRTHAHSGGKRYGPVHDILLFYSKSERPVWNSQHTGYSATYVDRFFRYQDSDGRRYRATILTGSGRRSGASGRPWRGIDPTLINRHWAIPGYIRPLLGLDSDADVQAALDALDAAGRILWPTKAGAMPSFKQYLEDMEGVKLQDIWTDLPPLSSQAKERLGYPTQKPETLLERILEASSSEADLVLDPFCGCGTTIAVAERLKRRWIGIDITHLAISLMRHRLQDTFGNELRPYEVIGDPKDVPSARALAEQDRFQFEWWALGLVDARPAQDKRKGADQGVDGYIKFFDGESKAKSIAVQVKSGHVGSSHIRDLKGVIDRENAAIGLLITLEEPTTAMVREAVSAGFYSPELYPNLQYPKLQILTISQLLNGEQPDYPHMGMVTTFKTAKRYRKPEGEQVSFMESQAVETDEPETNQHKEQ